MPKKRNPPIDPAEVRRARTEAGLSQQALADLVGCGRTEICAYERGRKCPGQQRIDQIAEALGVAVVFVGGQRRFVSQTAQLRKWLDGVNRP